MRTMRVGQTVSGKERGQVVVRGHSTLFLARAPNWGGKLRQLIALEGVTNARMAMLKGTVRILLLYDCLWTMPEHGR